MNRTILDLLRCPVCHEGMTETDDGRVCHCRAEKPHCFDYAKSGHIYLAGPHAGDGDTKEAVRARRAFLDAGYYQPLSDAVNHLLDEIGCRTVLDAGCGEGYYTNRMAESRDALGVDLSRAGVESAAKRARQMGTRAAFSVASIFSLPVRDASIDAVTNLFAPCAEDEFSRVLKDGGYLLLVGAGEDHLMGLKKAVYENPYQNVGRADLPTKMQEIRRERLRFEITVEGQEMIQNLFSMTPYYWRTSKDDREKLARLNTLTTTVDFDVFLFRKGL